MRTMHKLCALGGHEDEREVEANAVRKCVRCGISITYLNGTK